MRRQITLSFLALFFVTALLLQSCGGGGSSSSGGNTTSLSGTAATGAPIASAAITIKDATGTSKTATTGADGKYTIDVTGMTAPFLVQVTLSNGSFLYSVGAQAGVVNIHPLTDLIIQTWYNVQGKTINDAFSDPARNPPPTAAEVSVIAAVVEDIVKKWLTDNGIDPTTFDLISTSFDANSTGFDAVLDTLTVDNTNPAAPVITINAGTAGTQTSNLTVGNTGDISVSTSITVGSVTSTSFTSAFVPASAAAQTALSGVLTTLSNMAAVVNAKGASLAAADIRPFVDNAYLGGGKDADQFAANMASDLAGNTLDSFTVGRILSFDAANNIIAINGQATITSGGTTVVQDVKGDDNDGLIFKLQSDGSWKFFGDQQRAKVNLRTETSLRVTDPACTGCSGVFYDLQIQVTAPTGTVTSATVTGNIGGSTQTLAMTKSSGTFTDDSGLVTDQFDLLAGVGSTFYGLASASEFPPAGSSYTIHVVFADSTTADYTRVLGASTSEAMTLQAGVDSTVGHSFSATGGKSVTLNWNLPVTFPIATVEMYADVTDTNGNHCDTNGPDLAANATTGTMTLPATCNGLAVQVGPGYPSISIVVTGTSGESTNIWYAFQ